MMMLSAKAKTNTDACRFCWMCRHVCPVGQQTGKEINNARAKGLLLSLTERGMEYDASMAEAMWECVLCGACSNDCATGYEPPVFIREARTQAVLDGLVPANVKPVMDAAMEYGNIYGIAPGDKLSALRDSLSGLPSKADTLLYIGDVTAAKTPEIAAAAAGLLKKAGVPFTVLKDEPSTGAYLGDLIGYVEEVQSLGRTLSGAIDAAGAKTVVVLDPMDARIMKHEYAVWGIAPKAVILTATVYFSELLKKGALQPAKVSAPAVVTFHDAGALARDMDETEPGRAILGAMGFTVKEMFLSGKLAKSSGGALLQRYSPRLSGLLAKGRWEDALRTGARILVTEAPGSFAALSSEVPDGWKLNDLIVMLADACKA